MDGRAGGREMGGKTCWLGRRDRSGRGLRARVWGGWRAKGAMLWHGGGEQRAVVLGVGEGRRGLVVEGDKESAPSLAAGVWGGG